MAAGEKQAQSSHIGNSLSGTRWIDACEPGGQRDGIQADQSNQTKIGGIWRIGINHRWRSFDRPCRQAPSRFATFATEGTKGCPPGAGLNTLETLQKRGQNLLNESFEEANRDSAGKWKDLSGDRSFYEAARSKAQEGLGYSRFVDPEGHKESGQGGEEAGSSASGYSAR